MTEVTLNLEMLVLGSGWLIALTWAGVTFKRGADIQEWALVWLMLTLLFYLTIRMIERAKAAGLWGITKNEDEGDNK